jgi:hypothetical protein
MAVKFLVTDSIGNSKRQKNDRFIAEYMNVIAIDDVSNIVRYIGL